jgi:hypothetical protein
MPGASVEGYRRRSLEAAASCPLRGLPFDSPRTPIELSFPVPRVDWVIGSVLLLWFLFYVTWQVDKGRMNRWVALLAGVGLVLLNYLSLGLAVLAQFWVVLSTLLATWQFVNLVRVCFPF